jgi:hypothetical protein
VRPCVAAITLIGVQQISILTVEGQLIYLQHQQSWDCECLENTWIKIFVKKDLQKSEKSAKFGCT